MKKILLPFFIISLSIFTIFLSLNSHASTPEQSLLIRKADQLLQNWQPKQAMEILNQLNSSQSGRSSYSLYFQSKIHFYLGNYREAKKIMKRLQEKEVEWKKDEAIVRLNTLIDSTLNTTKNYITEKRGHFSITFKEGKDRILLDDAFHALEQSYQVIGKALGYFPDETVRVEIFPDSESFTLASGLPKEAVETSGTCALCNYNKILIISPRGTLRGYRWLDTLCHEYIHYTVYKIAGTLTPLWMHEGLAKYMETQWRKEKGRVLTPPEENLLARRLKDNTLVTFEQMTPSFAFLETSQDVQLAFSQVMTIIEYLDEKEGMQGIRTLLQKIAGAIPVKTAIFEIYDTTLETLLADWKIYLQQKGLKIRPDLYYEKVVFKDPDEKNNLDELEVNYIHSKTVRKFVRLGDMLKTRSRPKAAAAEYEKAKKESDALSPVLENKLATAYSLAGQTAKAKAILLNTKQIFPDFVTTYINLGKIYLSEQQEQSRAYLEEAKTINPFNPWVYTILASLYEKMGLTKKLDAVKKELLILQKPHQ